jgi:alkanesulfonate monooxygenase SsuD/methylene tetrahydromethanopterin reductase-like flavin-dependent oxidoreductase (luciferase family)
VGVFVIPPAVDAVSDLYRQTIAAGAAAERDGFDSFWLAEGHFSPIGVTSSLTLLAALAQATERIDLGTAVIPLAFDQPLRLAETAATVHALSDGRLQLGLGKGNGHGFSASAYAAFGLAEADRDALFAHALADFRRLLQQGAPVGDDLIPIYPPAGELAGRLWQATSTIATAVAAARSGDGLQLHRLVFGGDTGTLQRELVDAYLREFDTAHGAPRIAASRAVHPAASREEALTEIQLLLDRPGAGGLSLAQPGQSAAEYVDASNTHIGTPADILASLLDDAAVRSTTDLLLAPALPLTDARFAERLSWLAGDLVRAYRAVPLVGEPVRASA